MLFNVYFPYYFVLRKHFVYLVYDFHNNNLPAIDKQADIGSA